MNTEVIQKMSKYNFYAEQVSTFMAQNNLIYDEEVSTMEEFIRGCA